MEDDYGSNVHAGLEKSVPSIISYYQSKHCNKSLSIIEDAFSIDFSI